MPFRRTQYGYRPRGYSNASSRGGHSNSDSNASAPSAFTYRGQRGRRAQRGRWSFGRRGSGFAVVRTVLAMMILLNDLLTLPRLLLHVLSLNAALIYLFKVIRAILLLRVMMT